MSRMASPFAVSASRARSKAPSRRILAEYARDRRGAIAIIFVVALIPLLAAAGAAIDLSRAYVVKQRLGYAVDAAGLAVGAQTNADEDALQELLERYFAANYQPGEMGVPAKPTMQITGNTIVVSATAEIDATLMRIMGVDKIDVGASATVVRSSQSVELAMVLDVTGSMDGQRMDDLKVAAADLVDIVVQDLQEPHYTKIAIVPYSMGVNVGSYASSVRGSVSSGTCTSPGCQKYRFTNAQGDNKTFEISTCVSERTGSQAYTDAAPSTAPVGRNYPSSPNPCPSSKIVPLTSSKSLLKQQIKDLPTVGSTAGQIGLAWGWYMVSPEFGYLWPSDSQPAAYGTKKLIKVVVLMTDGEFNTVYCNGVVSKNSTSGSGASSNKINCNGTNGSPYTQSKTLCTNMKAKGIIVYTVGFHVGSSTQAKDVLESCATDPSYVHFPESGSELKDAFKAIAQSVSNLRLAQ